MGTFPPLRTAHTAFSTIDGISLFGFFTSASFFLTIFLFSSFPFLLTIFKTMSFFLFLRWSSFLSVSSSSSLLYLEKELLPVLLELLSLLLFLLS